MTAPSDINQTRWQAVSNRQPDAGFVYAVISTGVYCRPDCPSRRARRENVRFFDTGRDAEAAGFRACKRCRPDQPAGDAGHPAVTRACAILDTADEAPPLEALARAVGLSPWHLQRVFKAQTGLTPKRYAMALRKRRLRDNLPGAASVTAAIYDAGYGASSRAYADGADHGMTPSRMRAGGAGERLRYATATSSLGPLVVAATDRGICLVEFAAPAQARATLLNRFPNASLEAADGDLSRWVGDVVTRIDNPAADDPGPHPALPLDIRGTAFQEKVWQALTRIPTGQTRSYAQVARDIGQPRAARAVARACAGNTLAVLVPCHRVVRSDGESGGYRWGEARKRTLLAREREAADAGS